MDDTEKDAMEKADATETAEHSDTTEEQEATEDLEKAEQLDTTEDREATDAMENTEENVTDPEESEEKDTDSIPPEEEQVMDPIEPDENATAPSESGESISGDLPEVNMADKVTGTAMEAARAAEGSIGGIIGELDAELEKLNEIERKAEKRIGFDENAIPARLDELKKWWEEWQRKFDELVG